MAKGYIYILYEARTKVLNNYIKDKIARGELQDKKFEISIYSPIYMRYMNLTQEDDRYLVSISGIPYPTLAQLMTVVDYFAKPDWKPFIVDFTPKRSESEHNKTLDFFETDTGYAPYTYQPFTIWKREDISLEYSGDSLRYLIGEKPLSFQVNATLPIKIKDRYLFLNANKSLLSKICK